MNEVKRGIATTGRICSRSIIGTIIPSEGRTIVRPHSIVEIEVFVLAIGIIDIRIIVQSAQRCTDGQIIYEGVLQELLLGEVPSEGETIGDSLTVAFRKTS